MEPELDSYRVVLLVN